jgi:hypothetical protein
MGADPLAFAAVGGETEFRQPHREDDVEELVGRMSDSAGIDAETATKAAGLILVFLNKQGAQPEIGELLASMSGAEDLVSATAQATSGGPMATAGSGGLIALVGELASAGLDTDAMQAVGRAFFAYAREKIGAEKLGRIAAAIPGLEQFV